LIVTTKKIAARVRGAETGCETATGADARALVVSDAIGIQPVVSDNSTDVFNKGQIWPSPVEWSELRLPGNARSAVVLQETAQTLTADDTLVASRLNAWEKGATRILEAPVATSILQAGSTGSCTIP
jgi:hypothetical protein